MTMADQAPQCLKTGHPMRPPAGGFSVVEMFVVVILVSIMGAAVLVALLSGQTSFVSADAYVYVQGEARRAFDSMTRELHGAGGTPVQSVLGDQLDFQLALSYNPPAGVVLGARDQTGVDRIGWRIRYRVSVNGTTAQLVREVYDAAAGGTLKESRVLANNVNAATTSFNWNGGTRIVTLKLQARVQNASLPNGSQQTGVLTYLVKLRNS
ncbi:MAG: hypothetical protein HYZ91_02310 [Candidatus Omnitrophica bacterium]|nr:hypothetical protein [Candidatus Omnitrophota bacterium]